MIKVLVVDDDEDVCGKALHCLSRADLNLSSARNGQAALELARKIKPDIVITDVDMPIMDGFELLEALRAEPDLAGLQIMMLTSEGARHAVRLGMELGADDYLTKPFTKKELLSAFDGLMRKRGRMEGARIRTFRRHWAQVGAAYLVTLLCCGAAAYAWHGWSDARDNLDAERARLQRAAESTALHSREMFTEAGRVLIKVRDYSANPAVPPKGDCREFFKRLVSQSRAFVNVGVVGKDGRIECEALDNGEGAYVGDRPHVRQALRTGTFAPGDFSISKRTGQPVLTTALPLRDANGEPAGVAFSVLDIAAVAEGASLERGPPDAPAGTGAATGPSGEESAATAASVQGTPETVSDQRNNKLLVQYLVLLGITTLVGTASVGWATGAFAKWKWFKLLAR